jgi:regulator of sigma E protease
MEAPLELLRTLGAFVVALGAIVLVHEAGHFLVARWFGMRVLAFSIGFGRRIWGFERGGTEYRIGWLPLGGYVKLSGEELGEESSSDPRDFRNRPRWQRILVYLAGPMANAVFSWAVVSFLLTVGLELPVLSRVPAEVGFVEPGSPAETAGLQPGDRILAIDGRQVADFQEVLFRIATAPDRALQLEVEDLDGRRKEVRLIPTALPGSGVGEAGVHPRILPRIGEVFPGSPAEAAGLRPGDELLSADGKVLGLPVDFVRHIEARPGQPVRLELLRAGERFEVNVVPREEGGVGRIGVRLTIARKLPIGQAMLESFQVNAAIVRQTLEVVGKIFRREVGARAALGGPIEIAAQSGEAARSGWKSFGFLLAFLSISIGLLNLFPIPILDGGQVAILLVESLLRRDLPVSLKERLLQLGVWVVVLLMITVFYFDLAKRFGR